MLKNIHTFRMMDPNQLDNAIQGTLIMMGFPYDENKKGSAAIQLLELTADYTESSHLNFNQFRSKSIELNSQDAAEYVPFSSKTYFL